MSNEDRRVHVVPDLLIGEQIRQEAEFGPRPDGVYFSRKVAEGLTRQMPHRIYGGSNGTAMRAFFHRDRLGQAVSVEVLKKNPENKLIRLQYEVTNGTELSQIVDRSRRRYGLYPSNVVSEPDMVYVMKHEGASSYHFTHLGMRGANPYLAYHYILSPLGPYCIGLEIGPNIKIPSHAIELTSPPDRMVEHGI